MEIQSKTLSITNIFLACYVLTASGLAITGFIFLIISAPLSEAKKYATVETGFTPAYEHIFTVTAVYDLSPGSLIKGSAHTVYYLGDDYKRYVFPNRGTFFSWYDNFNDIKQIPDIDMAIYPIGGNVTYKPGVRLVKIESSPRVYVVDNGAYLRWIPTEEMADELYGAAWNTNVEDIPIFLFFDYIIGSPLEVASDFDRTEVITGSANITEDWKRWKVARIRAINIVYDDPPLFQPEETIGTTDSNESATVVSSILLSALDVSAEVIQLRWISYGVGDLRRFHVFRDSSLTLQTTEIGNYTDRTVIPNTTYRYFIEARDGKGETIATSNTLSITTPSMGSLPTSEIDDIPSTPAPDPTPTPDPTPDPEPTPVPEGVIVIDDLDADGIYTGNDVELALALCEADCTVHGLAVTYEDVEVRIPSHITGTLVIEGEGVGQTVFRAKAQQVQPVFRKFYQAEHVTFKQFTIEGRKTEQISAINIPVQKILAGIAVIDYSGLDRGPGLISNVEIKDIVHTGVSIMNGNDWIVENSTIHDIGCSDIYPCPALVETNNPDRPIKESGFGIIILNNDSLGSIVRNNHIYNTTKIGIEAYVNADNFYFHDNFVHHTQAGGITINGSSIGIIENNIIEDAYSHGMSSAGTTSNVTWKNNTIRRSFNYGMNMQAWGENNTIIGNTIENNCTGGDGSTGNGLYLGASISPSKLPASNWLVKDNIVDETICIFSTLIVNHDNMTLDNNLLQGGNNSTIIMWDATNITFQNTTIDGRGNLRGILFLNDIDTVTIQADTVITGSTIDYLINDPATIFNIIDER